MQQQQQDDAAAEARALALMKEDLNLKDDFSAPLAASQRYADLSALQQALLNEKLSPDILPYETGVVSRIRKKWLRAEKPAELRQGQSDHFGLREKLYELDEERMRYRLAEYWRVRMAKIQAFVTHILTDDALLFRLSPFELEFAKGYMDLMEKHLNENVANLLPASCSSMLYELDEDSRSIVAVPNVSTHVIAQILQPDLGVLSDDDDSANYRVGTAIVAQYHKVSAALLEGKVCLI